MSGEVSILDLPNGLLIDKGGDGDESNKRMGERTFDRSLELDSN